MIFIFFRIKYHIANSATHLVHLVLAYVLMLAVMTYNGWLLIALAIGKYLKI